VQAVGALAGSLFAFVAGGVVWLALSRLPGGIRVSAEHEHEGLDLAECGVAAYGEEVRGAHADLPISARPRPEAGPIGAARAPRAGA